MDAFSSARSRISGVLVVDYRRAYGPSVEFEHGLSRFIWDFDAGRHSALQSR